MSHPLYGILPLLVNTHGYVHVNPYKSVEYKNTIKHIITEMWHLKSSVKISFFRLPHSQGTNNLISCSLDNLWFICFCFPYGEVGRWRFTQLYWNVCCTKANSLLIHLSKKPTKIIYLTLTGKLRLKTPHVALWFFCFVFFFHVCYKISENLHNTKQCKLMCSE